MKTQNDIYLCKIVKFCNYNFVISFIEEELIAFIAKSLALSH